MSLGNDMVRTDDSKGEAQQPIVTPRIFTDEFRIILKEIAQNKSADSFNPANLQVQYKKLTRLFMDHNIDSLDLAIYTANININDHLGTIARCMQGTPVTSVSINASASKPAHETQIKGFALNLGKTNIKHVDLSYCPIGSTGLITFLEALSETKDHRVESLNISKCALKDKHKQIAALIKKLKLKTVQIDFVDFDIKAQQCLEDELTGTDVRVFLTYTQRVGERNMYILDTKNYELILTRPELPNLYMMTIDDSASKTEKPLTPQYTAHVTNTSNQPQTGNKPSSRNDFMTHMRKKSMRQ